MQLRPTLALLMQPRRHPRLYCQSSGYLLLPGSSLMALLGEHTALPDVGLEILAWNAEVVGHVKTERMHQARQAWRYTYHMSGLFRGMQQEAWQLAITATDWADLHGERLQMTDAELAVQLAQTAVAQAASLCYGPSVMQRVPKRFRYGCIMSECNEYTSARDTRAAEVIAI